MHAVGTCSCHRPHMRVICWFLRSDSPFCVAVGSCFPPGFMGVNTDHQYICRPLSLSFWTKPRVGLLALTTVRVQVRHSNLLEVFPHRVWEFTPFPPASRIDGQSLPRGECCSSFHLEGWELRPPSNYQLSSGQHLSRCCSSPVFTVSDKRVAHKVTL